MMYLLLIVGFVLLVKGADMFVDGSSSIAGILKVPSLIIGLTIVAMGTSAPRIHHLHRVHHHKIRYINYIMVS